MVENIGWLEVQDQLDKMKHDIDVDASTAETFYDNL